MDPRTNKRRSTATSEDSFVFYVNGGPPTKKGDSQGKRRRRACPVLAFLGLLLHFLSAGCGVALSVIIVRFGLQVASAGAQDLVARILVFVASCMGIFYVLMHASAAREKYVRSHGGSQFFRFFTVAVAFIIMRLEAPVWIAAVVMTALVAAQNGFVLDNGVQGNVIWIQLGIASLGLLSLFLMVIITERTDRPFATSVFSKKSFIKGTDRARNNRTDTFDMSVSRQGFRNDEKKGATATQDDTKKVDARVSVYDRSLIVTPTSAEEDSDGPAPTIPALPANPDWRQRRDAALRDTMRADVARSQAVPSPLTEVYGPATPPDTQDSPKKYGSHFSWRPPTRDSTFSARTSQTVDDYRQNWPPTPVLEESMYPNRASAAPPSEPPTVPLPPLLPPPEGTYLAETGNAAEVTTLGGTRTSQRSTVTVSTLPDIESALVSDEQPTSNTDAQVTTTSTTPEEEPTEEAPRPRGRRPALPSLEKLSARAAARHNRTSLLVREADLKTGPFLTLPKVDTTKEEALPRPSPELVEIPRPDIKPRDFDPRDDDSDDSGFESEDDDTGPEEPQPRPRHRSRSLLRGNTGGARLVRNFSRPRVPSGLLRRRPSESGHPPSGSRRDSIGGGGVFPAPGLLSKAQQFRRSRSMPPVPRRGSKASERSNTTTTTTTTTTNPVEVEPASAAVLTEPTVPILQPAPARRQQQQQQQQQQQDGEVTAPKAPAAPAAPAPKKTLPPHPAPRFSPFPSAATSNAPEKKVKGLGQGSLRRLEQRVTRWREEVDPLAQQDPAQAELDAERRSMMMTTTTTTTTEAEAAFDNNDHVPGIPLAAARRRPSVDDEGGDGRRSTEGSGRGRLRARGLAAAGVQVSNKLSREKSMTGRARRAAQNF